MFRNLPRLFVKMERTPNPRTFLFTSDSTSTKFTSPVAFEKSVSAANSSVASEILNLPGVERLLLYSPNSASVTLSSEIFADSDFESAVANLLNANTEDLPVDVTGKTDGVEAAISQVLDSRIRPSVQADGGDVDLISYDAERKAVLLRMRGACEGCPSSEQTLRNSITQTLKFYLPNDVEIVECLESTESGPVKHVHDGQAMMPDDKEHLIKNVPFVSLFAAKPADAAMKARVSFSSHLKIPRERIDADLVVQLKCGQCGAVRALEAIDSLLLNQPQKTGTAAVVICPACVVICSVKD